jgi:hypothetical protein
MRTALLKRYPKKKEICAIQYEGKTFTGPVAGIEMSWEISFELRSAIFGDELDTRCASSVMIGTTIA